MRNTFDGEGGQPAVPRLLPLALTAVAVLLLGAGCGPVPPAVSTPAQTALASRAAVPRMTDPLDGSPQLMAAVASGLSEEVRYLDHSAGVSGAAGPGTVTAGPPIPVRTPSRLATAATLEDYFRESPSQYLVPVLAAGNPVGEFTLNVRGDRVLPGGASLTRGTTAALRYLEGAKVVRSALGTDVVLVYTPRPTMAVVGWSERGAGAVFWSIEGGREPSSAPQPGVFVPASQALGYARAIWGRASATGTPVFGGGGP